MSLDWHLVPDAWADLHRLDPSLSEDVLDEVERLAGNPESLPSPIAGRGIVHTFPRLVELRLRVLVLSFHRSADGLRLISMGVDELIVP